MIENAAIRRSRTKKHELLRFSSIKVCDFFAPEAQKGARSVVPSRSFLFEKKSALPNCGLPERGLPFCVPFWPETSLSLNEFSDQQGMLHHLRILVGQEQLGLIGRKTDSFNKNSRESVF